MMVQQSVSTEIGVKTYDQTYSYTVAKSIEVMVKYLNQRGLDTSKLADQRELLDRGIYAWMAGRHIKKIKIEVYNQLNGQLIEQFEIDFEHRDSEDVSGQTEKNVENKDFGYYWSEVQQALADHDSLPEEADYRILISVGPNSDGQDPPDIEGWGTATPKDDSHLDHQEYGDSIDTGNISGTFEFWGAVDTEAVTTQFTPLPRTDTSDVRVQTEGNSLADKLVPTPHTLLQLPKSQNQAYFYYFTDEMYSQTDSKYRILDERLTLFGRHRGGVKVILIDRDRILNSVWDTLMDGLGLGNYPVLIVAESSLGIEDVNSETSEFKPHDVTYTMIEAGIVAEHILEDSDRLNAFLNQLYDGARDGSVRKKMTEQKIIDMLTVGKKQIEDLITFSA